MQEWVPYLLTLQKNIGKTFTSNGRARVMDVAPFMEKGRTYVPLRHCPEGGRQKYLDKGIQFQL